MRIRIQDITEAIKEVSFAEPTSALNPLVEGGPVHDFRFSAPARVRMTYYRGGQDLFLDGVVSTPTMGQCARCLENYSFDLETAFSFALVPRSASSPTAEPGVEDAELSYYEGDEVDVSPLVREQILLALPIQALCRTDCRGLCATCGANLNVTTCDCYEKTGDPRFAVLRELKVRT